ncbi:MAG TPA: hypothetical protein PLT29_06930 [Bacteroidales bacterium]|nr:hypothetical protein [Bacteroidales bacterium]
MGDSIEMSSNFDTGDVKVVTRAYAQQSDQYPNDLALIRVDTLLEALKAGFPDMSWAPRIRFGALADFPDSLGETRGQGPVSGWAVDLLGEGLREPERFNLPAAIARGRMPEKREEVLLAENLAARFDVDREISLRCSGQPWKARRERFWDFCRYSIMMTAWHRRLCRALKPG